MHFGNLPVALIIATASLTSSLRAAPQDKVLYDGPMPPTPQSGGPIHVKKFAAAGPCAPSCNVIDFEGIGNNVPIGTVAGTPSVTFGPSWLGLIDADSGGNGNFANEPSASTVAYFLTPVDPIDFSEPVRFVEIFYSASSSSVPVTLTAYDGPGGTGNVVATDVASTVGVDVQGAPCSGDPTGNFCLWDVVTLTSPTDNIKSIVLSGAVANQFGFDNMTFCISGDMDGDSLLDHWETCGIDWDEDGTIDLDLPALGADPAVKDVFIEVDAMNGFAPATATLARVTAAFANHGIVLHPILDETDITPAEWTSVDAHGWPTAFDPLKASRFGTAAERAHADWLAKIKPAKQQAFRYCVFADEYGGHDSSGQAEIGGNDFYVSLGHPLWGTATTDPDFQAGTFMHELGHTLRLLHGGGDHTNCKPNYHSVMNYMWQNPNVGVLKPYWTLDYANSGVSTLDEAALSENAGIGGLAGSRVLCGPSPESLFDETGAVDWNGDGDKTDIGHPRDLNQIAQVGGCGSASPGEKLTNQNDWTVLDFNFRDTTDFADGVHIHVTLDELTAADNATSLQACSPVGRYCVAKVDSQGCVPAIGSSGTPSLSGADDFFVTASNVRSAKNGILAWSPVEAATPFAGGTLCVGSPMLRGPATAAGGSGLCDGALSFHFSDAYVTSQGLKAGDAVFAQIWYRDPGFAEPNNIGLTDGLIFALCP